MVTNGSVEPNGDSSLEFRKCWALGEAYYYLEDKKPSSKTGVHECFMFYMSRLESIQTICESLGINNDEINKLVNKLQEEINNKKDSIERSDFVNLEYLLVGNLIGKDPRYEYIFRAAKHCQALYKIDVDINNFINDLNLLKNFISRDKLTLIKEICDHWKVVQKEYLNPNQANNQKTGNNECSIDDLNDPRLVGVVNRVAGLTLGIVEISDILKRWDRFEWVLICYVGLGLIIALPIAIIILFVVYNAYQHFVVNFINQLVPSSTQDLINILTAGGILAAALITAFKSFFTTWKRFASWFELKLAIQRMKHPFYSGKRIFPFLFQE